MPAVFLLSEKLRAIPLTGGAGDSQFLFALVSRAEPTGRFKPDERREEDEKSKG